MRVNTVPARHDVDTWVENLQRERVTAWFEEIGSGSLVRHLWMFIFTYICRESYSENCTFKYIMCAC